MNDSGLRDQLLKFIDGRNTHMNFQDAIADFPISQINSFAPQIPYSAWQLIEHMRISQRDILEFVENINYVELKWPDDYWPHHKQAANDENWFKTIKEFQIDLEIFKEIVKNPKTDLFKPLSHGTEYTVLREILLVVDHNSYHIGQIISLKRALNIL